MGDEVVHVAVVRCCVHCFDLGVQWCGVGVQHGGGGACGDFLQCCVHGVDLVQFLRADGMHLYIVEGFGDD